jgi:hypothetical protein
VLFAIAIPFPLVAPDRNMAAATPEGAISPELLKKIPAVQILDEIRSEYKFRTT